MTMMTTETKPIPQRPEQSLAEGVRYLLSQQSPDGAWRSGTYGTFKGGDALTPLALHALQLSADSAAGSAIHKGVQYLADKVHSDGAIDEGPFGLDYPVYSAALSALVLEPFVIDKVFGDAQAAWLSYLKRRQLNEQWGWQPEDTVYGGWGYSKPFQRNPEIPKPTDQLALPNLSATVFAVEALAAVADSEDPALSQALHFIKRCQNYADNPEFQDPVFDDGGFFFIQGDSERNKAGAAGIDRHGKPRFSSYGSTTADGLRALVLCGLDAGDVRVRAVLRWLESNIREQMNPGKFAGGREAVQASLQFYYHWSLAKTIDCCAKHGIISASKQSEWSQQIADRLIVCQNTNGYWINDAVEVREDDPIVATSFAVGALAMCLDAM